MGKTLRKHSPILAACDGRTVAVIGRAWYLAESGLGGEIDRAEFVIRVNWTLPIHPWLAIHVGSHTNLVYTMQKSPDRFHLAAARAGVRSMPLNARLRGELASRVDVAAYIPNTGTVAIFDALEHGASEVRAYGFDFHASTRYADTGAKHDNRAKYAQQRVQGTMLTHDPDVDRGLLRGLLADLRFKPDFVLAGLLQ